MGANLEQGIRFGYLWIDEVSKAPRLGAGMTLGNSEVVLSFVNQTRWCKENQFFFSGEFLAAAARDIAHPPIYLEMIASWRGNPHTDRLPLRLMSAAHTLSLSGTMPDLTASFPSDRSSGDARVAWAIVCDAMATKPEFFRNRLAAIPQHNEIGRTAALLGGFLEIARQTSLPFRLLELGASAGLHQIWDKYSYCLNAEHWGSNDCPVAVSVIWKGSLPPLDQHPEVESRAACDLSPLSLSNSDHLRQLQSYVWPEQRKRIDLLHHACELAHDLGVLVDKERAGTWLPRKLQGGMPRQTTVVFNSFFWFYLTDSEKLEIRHAIIDAGEAADSASPLAWLRYEPAGLPYASPPELKLTLWPRGQTVILGNGHEQGRYMNWGNAQHSAGNIRSLVSSRAVANT